ncbi:hypothetical protein DFH06DRAFT_1338856 [Mycena polygramma]|nr:hypothetical protein DFH06DRAFT_1338856 [Mycena polygramma]
MAAPPNRRATMSRDCSGFNMVAIEGIEAARDSLGSINTTDTGNDLDNARSLLEAQISLVDANKPQFGPPAPPNASATIVAGLNASLASLDRVDMIISNDIKAAIAAFIASITSVSSALAAAQKAVAADCQGASSSSSAAATAAVTQVNLYSMLSVPLAAYGQYTVQKLTKSRRVFGCNLHLSSGASVIPFWLTSRIWFTSGVNWVTSLGG